MAYQTYAYGFTTGFNIVVALEWLPFQFLMIYSLLYLLLPLLIKNQITLFIPGMIVWMVLLFWSSYFVHYKILVPLNSGITPVAASLRNEDLAFTLVNFIMFLSQACVAATLKLFRYWYRKETINQQLVKEKIISELQLLKAQVHPHFLFNTLNNLYSLTLKKSARAPEVVKKLSELIQYMLQECSATEIAVEKEVRMIANYIELEKLRYGTRLHISMDITGELAGKYITPLLMIPFVENAFKHGASEQSETALIAIALDVSDKTFSFSISNSCNEVTRTPFGGIGLSNVKKRLQLLYPGQHQLDIITEENIYKVNMQVELGRINKKAIV